MITDVPDGNAFQVASINLLNLAWRIAIESLHHYDESQAIHHSTEQQPVMHIVEKDGATTITTTMEETFTAEERAAAESAYWHRSQPALGNALALVQQAVELALKGRIASVSPYLLIARDSRDYYPSQSDQKDTPFSAFRTIDAADLLKAHNTFCSPRLDDRFAQVWNEVRRQRNTFMHTVGTASKLIHPVDLLEHVLFINAALHPDVTWMKRRLAHKGSDELEAAYPIEPAHSYGGVMQEFETVSRHLASKSLKAYFGFDRRARHYLCPKCWDNSHDDIWDFERSNWMFAQLVPRSPTSTTLRCAFCQERSSVLRQRCQSPKGNCASNVLSNEDESRGTCLLCTHAN